MFSDIQSPFDDLAMAQVAVLVCGRLTRSAVEWFLAVRRLGGDVSVVYSPGKTTHVVTTPEVLNQTSSLGIEFISFVFRKLTFSFPYLFFYSRIRLCLPSKARRMSRCKGGLAQTM